MYLKQTVLTFITVSTALSMVLVYIIIAVMLDMRFCTNNRRCLWVVSQVRFTLKYATFPLAVLVKVM